MIGSPSELVEALRHKHQLRAFGRVPPDVLQFPLWQEEQRAIPNIFLRCALFSVGNRKRPRAHLRRAEIAVVGDGRITYTGDELRQDDETVWLQLVHLAKDHPAGSVVEFTAYSVIKAVGWAKSKPNNRHTKRLLEILSRMHAAVLAVHSKELGRIVGLSMIPLFEWRDEKSGERLPKWRIQIAPELLQLFANANFTYVDWQCRLALPVGLATWLHGYFSSHRAPYPIKLSTLQRVSGSTNECMRDFKRRVENALKQLEQKGFCESEIRGDLICVKRK